jgi:hypothetical protein
MFRRTTMRRAVIEAVAIFVVARLLAMVPASFWPGALFIVVLLVRLFLFIIPPVWAAMRVKSTKREKMSRRFWILGPELALFCVLADVLIGLFLGDALTFGGPAGLPDIVRFSATGAEHLAVSDFIVSNLIGLLAFTLYYTLGVICTRLANGGFMRFTMPAGNGRVTL